MHEEGMGDNDTWKCVRMLVIIGMNLTTYGQSRVVDLGDVWSEWKKGTMKTFWYKKIMRDASRDFVLKVVCGGLTAARAVWRLDAKKSEPQTPASEQQLLIYIWLIELIQGAKCRPQGTLGDLALKWYGYAVSMNRSAL